MKKQRQKLTSILLCFVMLIGLLPTTALAAGEINQVELTITEPTIGASLDFTADVDSASPSDRATETIEKKLAKMIRKEVVQSAENAAF